MMSRRKIFPSFNSSRQMMMAWKVSGLSQRPAIIASRPASMRLAMAISPSRESNSTEPISRRYMRTGSSVRSDGSFFSVVASLFGRLFAVFGIGVFGLDHVDAHLIEHRVDILDLVGGHFARGHDFVDLVDGDVAAFLGGLDHFLDAGIG